MLYCIAGYVVLFPLKLTLSAGQGGLFIPFIICFVAVSQLCILKISSSCCSYWDLYLQKQFKTVVIVNKCEVATEEVETNMSRDSLCACEALTVKLKIQQKWKHDHHKYTNCTGLKQSLSSQPWKKSVCGVNCTTICVPNKENQTLES